MVKPDSADPPTYDIVDRATRSRMMSGIRSKNTGPELQVRSALHRRGFRFRVNVKALFGTPDIVLPRYRAVVFVHGCFWHGHACSLFKLPKTRQDFWKSKIAQNQRRDLAAKANLLAAGWRIAILYECALKGKHRQPFDLCCDTLSEWIKSGKLPIMEISGDDNTDKLSD